MGGKGAILLVLAFSTIFLTFGHRYNSLSTRTIDNVSEYIANAQSYNIAVSAANIAANKLFLDKNWTDNNNYEKVQFNGGDYTIKTIRTSTVPTPSDTVLTLPNGDEVENPFLNKLVAIYAQSRYHINGVTPITASMPDKDILENEVVIVLRPSSFAKYGNFYNQITAIPATGDTFSGPFHAQGVLKTWGSPVFTGKVTSQNGLTTYNNPPPPEFQGGYNTGVDIPLQFDTTGMHAAAVSNGRVFTDTTNTNQRTQVRLEFLATGDVKYQQKIGAGSWSAESTVPLTTLSPNGMIFVERGNVFVKGVLNGQATVVASKRGKSGCGTIYQTDDIVYSYNDDPSTYPLPDDMLGLVAEENIRLQYNSDTRHNDITTQATMFALNGNVGPDANLVTNDHHLASWKILGGITSKTVRVTAHYHSSGPYEGYRFVQDYDERVQRFVAPFFPDTKKWEVVTWLEKKKIKPGQ